MENCLHLRGSFRTSAVGLSHTLCHEKGWYLANLRRLINFHQLNDVTIMDHYPLPKITTDFSEVIAGSTIFSKCDLTKAYLQIEVAEEDHHKTAINTREGIFQFKRMPFGLKNSAQEYIKNVNKVTQGLDGVFVYMDDIIIASQSEEEHLI